MANEFKIKNGLIIDQGGAYITGTTYFGTTGFTASAVFSGNSIGAISLATTGSTGFSLLTSSGAFSIYDNTNNSTRFVVSSTGDVGIGTTAPQTKLHLDGTIRIDNQTGTPAGGAQPGTPLYYYGADGAIYLSDPNNWLKIDIEGTTYYIPVYT